MKVSIDKNACIGCGACAAICPEYFEMGDDTKADVKKGKEKVGKADEKKVKEAVDGCPVSAIKIG